GGQQLLAGQPYRPASVDEPGQRLHQHRLTQLRQVISQLVQLPWIAQRPTSSVTRKVCLPPFSVSLLASPPTDSRAPPGTARRRRYRGGVAPVTVVTGGSRGIGAATAVRLAAA